MRESYLRIAASLLIANALAAAAGSALVSLGMSPPTPDLRSLSEMALRLVPVVFALSLPVMVVFFLPSALFVERRYTTRSLAGKAVKMAIAAAVGAAVAAILLPLLNFDRVWSLALGAIWAVSGAIFWFLLVPLPNRESSNA